MSELCEDVLRLMYPKKLWNKIDETLEGLQNIPDADLNDNARIVNNDFEAQYNTKLRRSSVADLFGNDSGAKLLAFFIM